MHELAQQLIALEQQAARCGRLLDGADDETLQMVVASFAPAPPKGHRRNLWSRYWLSWLQAAAQQWPETPPLDVTEIATD